MRIALLDPPGDAQSLAVALELQQRGAEAQPVNSDALELQRPVAWCSPASI